MSGVTFPNLLRGNRAGAFMGLRMHDGYTFRMAPDYTYVEVGLLKVTTDKGETVEEKIMRNQMVELQAPCTVAPASQYKVLVVPNPELLQVASGPSMLLFDFEKNPRDHVLQPVSQDVLIPMKFWKDTNINSLSYLARLYLVS